jgi:hypothetical protein
MQRSLARAAFSISPASVSSSLMQCIAIGKPAPNKCLKFARTARPTRKSDGIFPQYSRRSELTSLEVNDGYARAEKDQSLQ